MRLLPTAVHVTAAISGRAALRLMWALVSLPRAGVRLGWGAMVCLTALRLELRVELCSTHLEVLALLLEALQGSGEGLLLIKQLTELRATAPQLFSQNAEPDPGRDRKHE